MSDGHEYSADGESAADREARARIMGWKPESEYRGPAGMWRDVDDFLQYGETQLPVLRQQQRALSNRLVRAEQKNSTLEQELADQRKAVEGAMTLARQASEQGYQRAIRELKAEQRKAVEAGDTATFENLDAQIDAMQAERAKTAEPPPSPPAPRAPPAPPPPPTRDPAYDAFERANPEIMGDPDLIAEMRAAHDFVIKRNPTVSVAEQLRMAKDRVVRDNPEIFGDPEPPAPRGAEPDDAEPPPAPPPRRAAPTVLPPNAPRLPPGPRRSPFDTISDPAERDQAKRAYEAIKLNDPEFTPQEYMAIYEDPRIDVRDLRRQRKK